jgi:excisionase family DNA binding protein
MSLPTLLSVEELAGYLSKRPAAVRAMANRGELAFIRCGRAMRFREDDVSRFLEEHRRPASREKGVSGDGFGTRDGTGRRVSGGSR